MFLMIGLVVPVMAQPTARQWNAEVTAGWNLGNQLECSAPGQDSESVSFSCPANHMRAETAWGNPAVTQQTLQAVKDAGFNAVRIPVRWQCHITDAETMTVSADWIQRVKEVAGYALDLGMKVIINTHHDKWLESRPTNYYKENNNQKLALLWTNIANAFKDYDYHLVFAGTNEVHIPNNWNAPTAENLSVQNSYNQTFINAVRATGGNNLKRHLIVQTYACNADYGVNGQLVVPTDIEGNNNDYMSVEFHYYRPFEYCSGQSGNEGGFYFWGQAYSSYGNTSPSKETAMRNAFQQVADEWGSQGLGVIMGEWGVSDHWLQTYKATIRENMTYYCKTLVMEARQRGIAPFVWDNNVFGNGTEKYGIFDRNNNMALVADWTVSGIMEGVAAGIEECTIDNVQGSTKPRKFFHNGRLLIRKGNKTYTLQGCEN
jgi:endoglucanase